MGKDLIRILYVYFRRLFKQLFFQIRFIFTYQYGNLDDNSDVKSKTLDSFDGNSMIVFISFVSRASILSQNN